MYLLVFLVTVSYIFYLLKEYYTGEFYMPEFNALSDGLYVYFIVYGFFSYMGIDAMKTEVVWGLRPSHIYIILIALLQFNDCKDFTFDILNCEKPRFKVDRKNLFLVEIGSFMYLSLLIWIALFLSPN